MSTTGLPSFSLRYPVPIVVSPMLEYPTTAVSTTSLVA